MRRRERKGKEEGGWTPKNLLKKNKKNTFIGYKQSVVIIKTKNEQPVVFPQDL